VPATPAIAVNNAKLPNADKDTTDIVGAVPPAPPDAAAPFPPSDTVVEDLQINVCSDVDGCKDT
jgi:hypothetical protein